MISPLMPKQITNSSPEKTEKSCMMDQQALSWQGSDEIIEDSEGKMISSSAAAAL